MVRQVHAIFSQGAFRPVDPVALPEGTRVRLSVEEEAGSGRVQPVAKIHSPRLVRAEDAADFVMEVREIRDASV
jgi:predicted DNA-binding antitoxin AbrB/MazE fold protein